MSGHWIIYLLTCATAMADIETWTDKTGKTAELELWAVTRTDDVVTGHFRTSDGAKVSLPAARFAEPDAKRILEWNEMADLGDPQFDHIRIPKKSSFGPDPGFTGAESLEYRFSVPDARIVGIRKDGIVIQSCSLTSVANLPATQIFSMDGGIPPAASDPSWSLGTSLDYRLTGIEAKRRGLGLVFTLNHGGEFTIAQARKSAFKAEVVVAASNNLRVATLKFDTSDCLRGNRVIAPNGAPPANPKVVRNIGALRVWLEETPADTTANSPGELVVRLDEPYTPSSVKTTRILCNGEPVQHLSEIFTRTITVELECWTDIKEMTMQFEKSPSQPGT